MEINRHEYRSNLLSILRNIANASYVTFDLEMSGIRTGPRRSRDSGKPSLQQLYDENREAAQTFQILQLGITCIEEDREKDFYLARPYNFYLSPLTTSGKLDFTLDRTFSFSSSACDFLKGNHFDFGKVFSEGIPYLSQQEQREAEKEFENRLRANEQIADINIPASDASTLKFFRDARKKIDSWIKDEDVNKDDWINISSDDGPLNGYQRRLMYQLVRNYFPGYRTFAQANNSFMQVKKRYEEEEARREREKKSGFNAQISKQIGLRWIFEALTYGDLDGINPKWFCDTSDEISEEELALKSAELQEIREKLEEKQHIIVGHNLFTDLMFLYQTFVEDLPISVKHFQTEINQLFPVVFDTKFLASYGLGNMRPNTGLKDLLMPFKTIHTPLVLLAESAQDNYGSTRKEHEAGYDSWMTSELFIKLSHKLYQDRKHTLKDTPSSPSSTSNSDSEIPSHQQQLPLSTTSSTSTSTSSTNDPTTNGGVKLSPSSQSAFSSTNRFALFDSEEAEQEPEPESEQNIDVDIPGEYYSRQLNKVKSDKKQWLPKMTSSFWEVYVNKLQVNASEKGFCDLAEFEE